MTPMIDVVFLLLIFFVCAATGRMRESLLDIELPAGAIASPDKPPEPPPLGEVWVGLRLNTEGKAVAELNGTLYRDLKLLEKQLRGLAELAPEIPVILDVANGVTFGDMIRVFDVCRSAGFQAINFAIDTDAIE